MRKVLVVAGRPVFVIAEIPQLPETFPRLIRRDIVLEKLARSKKEESPKEQKEQSAKHDQEIRTIPDVKMPLWYRLKSAAREWYYGRNLWAIHDGKWAA